MSDHDLAVLVDRLRWDRRRDRYRGRREYSPTVRNLAEACERLIASARRGAARAAPDPAGRGVRRRGRRQPGTAPRPAGRVRPGHGAHLDHEWCTYRELDGIAVHQLITDDDEAVTTVRFIWDGTGLREADPSTEAEVVPGQGLFADD